MLKNCTEPSNGLRSGSPGTCLFKIGCIINTIDGHRKARARAFAKARVNKKDSRA
jgi:hypothetical protein